MYKISKIIKKNNLLYEMALTNYTYIFKHEYMWE